MYKAYINTHTHMRMYSCVQKFTHPFQNLQNVNYFTKIREIIQNTCYCLFSTDLNKIFHIKEKVIIVEFIKTTRSKVFTPLVLNTVLYLNDPQLCVFV